MKYKLLELKVMGDEKGSLISLEQQKNNAKTKQK